MSDALPLPGPAKVDCPCGCGLFGTPTRREHKDGLHHVKGCVCARCRGRNYKHTSSARERRIAKRAGGERSPLSGALSGYDIRVPLRGGSYVYIEETTEVDIWRGLLRWWNGRGVQRKFARVMALHGIRVARGPELSVLPTKDLDALLKIASEDT